MHETEKTEFHYELFKRLQYATHIVRRDTGLEIKNRLEIASFYGYMRDQYTSYSARGLEFFESMESMGLKFQDTDRRTVKKWLDVLNAIGLVISDKRGKDERGYDRYYHTVIPLEEIADNLLFYGSASTSGGLLADGMLIRKLEKKKPRGKPKQKSEKKQDYGKSEPASPGDVNEVNTAIPDCTEPQAATADQSPDLASESAASTAGQRESVAFNNDGSGDAGTDGNNAVKQPEIFDDRGVITEAFINNLNSLTGYDEPRRNDDGTLQSFRYVYGIAQQTQDKRDGVAVRPLDGYMAEAQPWHIPPHLLSTPTPEPEYDEDPNF
ncbi:MULTISPECIES: DUF6945 domain-containing protein [Enterobacteriaceae]|uniref:DUF6945 domain-containing protein n=1 Tax=Enterobacteriaceae TaxID=543 RepID=UPI000BA20851|nr:MULTISPECIES: hypothetical protein [Enterobacteriaceae]MDM9660370.1 hypothetical protein [Raoultella planticola]OZZ64836.1 hypothetical protein CDA25_04195 [Klebsiella pneumoniae]HDH1414242.1 hypothetical protein [Klebsiella quasipneumoniae subsp. similipneumoniae]ELT0795756.1 hypothetical protein [Klebsiella quasipneumoniae]MDM9665498.1 hypothetical protein [Raoultella planticola]